MQTETNYNRAGLSTDSPSESGRFDSKPGDVNDERRCGNA